MTPEDGEPLGMSANADKAAELFDLHFNRVYDFCLRVLGMPDAAADAAEESLRNALAAPATVGSFDVRLFSAALDALEPRLKLRHPSAIGSNPLFHQVDISRLADTTRAPSAQETAGLIWETLSRLDPADYVLLDLRFRQDLSEADLAAILKTNERAVKSRLSNLLKRTEPELSSLIVGRRGSRNCDAMRRAMLGLPIAATRGQVRKAVEKHVRSCPLCMATRMGLASPLSVMAAFSLVTLSSTESEAARGRIVAAADALPPIVTTAPVVKAPKPVVPVGAMAGAGGIAAAGGIGSAAGLGGPGIPRRPGLGEASRDFFGKIQFSNSRAIPIMGALVVLGVAVAIAFGSGMLGGSSGSPKATSTPTVTKTATVTSTPKATRTPTEEPTATEEATSTPEEATATPETTIPPTHTAGPATHTPKPPTATPEAVTPEATPEATVAEPTHTPHPTHTPAP
jgi:DNA-directed RNA polymerase specialized sigma24 family protein